MLCTEWIIEMDKLQQNNMPKAGTNMRLLCHTLKGQIRFCLEVYSVFSVFCILCRIQSVFSVRVFVPSVTVTCHSTSEKDPARIKTLGLLTLQIKQDVLP